MTSGMAFMTFTLTFAGVVQTHLQRVMGMFYMEVQDQLGLFYLMRFGAGLAVVLGAILFIYSQVVVRREVIDARPGGRSGRVTMNAHRRDRPRGSLLPRGRRRMRGLRGGPPPRPAAPAEGADRLRQDALRRAHGRAPRAAAPHGRLSRRPLGRRPDRSLPAEGRRDGLGGRSADPRRARGRHLLPRRGGRGAQGRHGRPPSRSATTAVASSSTAPARSWPRPPRSCSWRATTPATSRS